MQVLNYRFKLTVIGPSEDDLNELEDTIIAVNSNSILFNFKGKCTNKEVHDEMVNNDIFCTPSISEALGVSNIEALSLKLPVVYTNVGGVNEVLDNGRNGFMALPNNPESLAAAIEECIRSKDLRKEKVENGYNWVAEHFNSEKLLENFESLLNNYE